MRSFFLSLIGVLVFSCADHNMTCLVGDPVTELPWLAAEVKEMGESNFAEFLYVSQATYESETVFIFANCCPNCSSIYSVYNCKGESIGSIGQKEFPIDLLQKGRVIWKAENSSCVFR